MTDRHEPEIPGSDNPKQPEPAAPEAAPTSSDAPQAPQSPPGHPAPPTPPASTSSTSSYLPPVAPQPTSPQPVGQQPTAPLTGTTQPTSHTTPVPPAFGHAPTATAYQPAGVQPGAYATAPGVPEPGPYLSAAAASAAGEKTKKPRRAGVGIVAALAVGALVGGVAGAGVFAVITNSTQGSSVTNTATSPANITVNDAADATTVTAVAATAAPSVVTISVAGADASGTGSGVILSEDGYVLTNTHVVTLDGETGEAAITVQTTDGRLYQATLVGTDPISDLAVIKIDNGDSTFTAAQFADSSKLNVGDMAVAIGAPLGLSNTVTDGIVSALNRSITVASSAAPDSSTQEDDSTAPDSSDSPFDFWQFPNDDGSTDQQTTATSTISLSVIQTDAAINPGNSGGALLDSDGKVIGINVAIASAGSSSSSASGSIGVGFAIPANLAKRVAAEIIETGTGSHGLLGATIGDAATDTNLDDVTTVGASIQSISGGGPAEAAGLEAGDVITGVNDIPITSATDLTAQIRALAGGADATITYLRDGRSSTVDVTLGTL